jgi:hypothetical protein
MIGIYTCIHITIHLPHVHSNRLTTTDGHKPNLGGGPGSHWEERDLSLSLFLSMLVSRNNGGTTFKRIFVSTWARGRPRIAPGFQKRNASPRRNTRS